MIEEHNWSIKLKFGGVYGLFGCGKRILILSALLIGGLACGFEAVYEIKQGGKWRIWKNLSIGLIAVYAALVVILTMH